MSDLGDGVGGSLAANNTATPKIASRPVMPKIVGREKRFIRESSARENRNGAAMLL